LGREKGEADWKTGLTNLSSRKPITKKACVGREKETKWEISDRIPALAAPFTVNTMPVATLKTFANHGKISGPVPANGVDCENILAQFTKACVNLAALAAQLQDDGAKPFVKSWNELMGVIAANSTTMNQFPN